MAEEFSVLIVEDNDFIRMQIVSHLKGEGYGVVEATDGDRALEQLAARPDIALAIVDLRMEPMGGFEFLKVIRSENVALPVILVTGDQTADILENANRLGVAAVLMKPVEKARLIGTVARTIKGAKRA